MKAETNTRTTHPCKPACFGSSLNVNSLLNSTLAMLSFGVIRLSPQQASRPAPVRCLHGCGARDMCVSAPPLPPLSTTDLVVFIILRRAPFTLMLPNLWIWTRSSCLRSKKDTCPPLTPSLCAVGIVRGKKGAWLCCPARQVTVTHA